MAAATTCPDRASQSRYAVSRSDLPATKPPAPPPPSTRRHGNPPTTSDPASAQPLRPTEPAAQTSATESSKLQSADRPMRRPAIGKATVAAGRPTEQRRRPNGERKSAPGLRRTREPPCAGPLPRPTVCETANFGK